MNSPVVSSNIHQRSSTITEYILGLQRNYKSYTENQPSCTAITIITTVPPAAVTTAVLEALEAPVALVVLEVLEVLAAPALTIAPVSRNSVHRALVPTITRLHTTTSKVPGPDSAVQVPTTALDSVLGLGLMDIITDPDTMDLDIVVLVRPVSDTMAVHLGTMAITAIMDR